MDNLKVEHEQNICLVTVNRPDKLNALNKKCLEELDELFNEISKNNELRAVIITGEGNKAFVAGADIKELAGLDNIAGQQAAQFGQKVFSRIENCGKPVIAAVNGYALGGGCELALSASFRIASDNAHFGLPEVTLGLIPGYGGTQRLARLVGSGRAAQMILTAEMIDAETAQRWGLVNEVHSQHGLLDRAKQLAELITTRAPLALNKALQAINANFKEQEENGFRVEAELFGECFSTQDEKEGTSAFLEKRKPVFKGE